MLGDDGRVRFYVECDIHKQWKEQRRQWDLSMPEFLELLKECHTWRELRARFIMQADAVWVKDVE